MTGTNKPTSRHVLTRCCTRPRSVAFICSQAPAQPQSQQHPAQQCHCTRRRSADGCGGSAGRSQTVHERNPMKKNNGCRKFGNSTCANAAGTMSHKRCSNMGVYRPPTFLTMESSTYRMGSLYSGGHCSGARHNTRQATTTFENRRGSEQTRGVQATAPAADTLARLHRHANTLTCKHTGSRGQHRRGTHPKQFVLDDADDLQRAVNRRLVVPSDHRQCRNFFLRGV